jgi:hypothetical protein
MAEWQPTKKRPGWLNTSLQAAKARSKGSPTSHKETRGHRYRPLGYGCRTGFELRTDCPSGAYRFAALSSCSTCGAFARPALPVFVTVAAMERVNRTPPDESGILCSPWPGAEIEGNQLGSGGGPDAAASFRRTRSRCPCGAHERRVRRRERRVRRKRRTLKTTGAAET